MIRQSPKATLLLLLAAAASLLAAGVMFSRQVVTERQTRDREPLRAFAGTLQGELQRLERLHESHLARAGREAPVHDRQAVWRFAQEVVGIAQFSFLQAGAESDLHVPIAQPGRGSWPEPIFAELPGRLPSQYIVVPRATLLEGPETSGWIDQPGTPLMYWARRGTDACAVMIVNAAEVAATVDAWLQDWLAARGTGLGAAGATDQIESPSGSILSRAGEAPDAPADYIIPMRTRIGTWQIASWEPRVSRIVYSVPTLVGAVALAGLLAAIGFVVSAQQRRALRLAEERVSFVNAVSHELRVPLTNILLNLEFARERLEETEGQPDYRLHLVEEEARRLTRLIDNVLTFSRQERQGPRLQPRACVPASVVQEVVSQFGPSFARRGLSISRADLPAEARLLDADALAQILGNLLSNVEKYVPGGRVEIAGEMEGNTLVITVADEGPGIPETAFERVFLPFERLEVPQVSRGVSGTGLGLSIARGLAREMGGSLKLRPSARGACFELRVLAPPASAIQPVSAA